MDNDEFIRHWSYFCSLVERLDSTKHFIDHGLIEQNGNYMLAHGGVYSDVFKQIILLASSEFEVMSKALCSLRGYKKGNIRYISKAILKEFPRIITFEMSTPFWSNKPFEEWRVEVQTEDGKKTTTQGIEWWKAYTALKHGLPNALKLATLENAIVSLESLYIINLYIMRQLFGNMRMVYLYPVVYFRCPYVPYPASGGADILPDYDKF